MFDKIILKLSKFIICRYFFKFFRIFTSFEKSLTKKNIDLIIFPTPSDLQYSIIKTKFITTIFDLCHLEHKKFPEVNYNEYIKREKFYSFVSSRAEAIITNSSILKKQISKRYNYSLSKIFSVPFNPSKKKYKKKMINKSFFLYPANYWEHKNHKIIIQAVKILVKDHLTNFKCIFTGSDKGYLNEINRLIRINNLKNYFEVKKFVDEKYLINLYKNCLGVIMTSHFGPTNLPPLESFIYKKPLIYNSKFSNEIPKKNCLMVNVNNSSNLAKAMKIVLNKKYSKQLLINAENFIKLKKKMNIKQILNLETLIKSKI